jgi:TonB family protein
MRLAIAILIVHIAMFGSVCAQQASKRASIVVYAIFAVNPNYTAFAQRHQIEGTGVFQLHIRADGRVSSVEIVQTTGHPELDQSAISAFSSWRFQPPGRPAKLKMPITFTTKNPPANAEPGGMARAYQAIPE